MLNSHYCSIDDAQSSILSQLLSFGLPASPRNEATVESLAVSFSIENPRARCVLNTARRWNLPFALGELCWHLSGSKDASVLTYYSRAWSAFADSNGQIRGSCYGSKVFRPFGSGSLWEKARDLLRIDSATRRAVLYFNDAAAHLDALCPDAACASSLQFMIRGGSLHAFVSMRSNDVIWGLPYDVFLFTFLQEMMALELGLSLGSYYHFAASMHLYERHRDLAHRILDVNPRSPFFIPPLERIESIPRFLDVERCLREGTAAKVELNPYWEALADVFTPRG